MAVRIDMPRILPSLETKKTSAWLPEDKRKEIIKSSLLHQRGSPGVWNRTVFFVVVNVASSVGIVVTNKWVFEKYKFQFGTMLTVIHFSTTFLGLYVCSLFRLFQPKPLPLSRILGVVLAFCGFVVLTNLSLQHNSVGFYQLTKTLTTPTIMLVQTFFYGVSFSSRIQLALVVTCIGVILASVTDVQLNPLGTTYALAGVLITSLYQIWVGTKQKELDVDAWQLLYNQAPLSAGILLVFVPLLDDVQKLRDYPFTKESVFAIASSGILAFAVNISIFMIIGRTSPVTYNVVGHFKTCLILAMGVLLFSYPVNHKNFMGIAIALTGIFWYSYINSKTGK